MSAPWFSPGISERGEAEKKKKSPHLLLILGIDVGPLGQKKGDHVVVPPSRRPEQGRVPDTIACLRWHSCWQLQRWPVVQRSVFKLMHQMHAVIQQ